MRYRSSKKPTCRDIGEMCPDDKMVKTQTSQFAIIHGRINKLIA